MHRKLCAVLAALVLSVLAGCTGNDDASSEQPTSDVPVTEEPTKSDKPDKSPTVTPDYPVIPVGAQTDLVKQGTPEWDELCHGEGADSYPDSEMRTTTSGPTQWKNTVASTFYIGEEANASNAHIDNIWTAWYSHTDRRFGGVDSWGPSNPETWSGPRYKRDGWCPTGIKTIKLNPFYVALPALDHDENGLLEEAYPWVDKLAAYLPELRRFKDGVFGENQSPFKNLWVQVEYKGRSVFAQWEDVGPSSHTGQLVSDYEYVAGDNEEPKNEFRLGAGIDLSPAATDYLGTRGQGDVRWRFVPGAYVPDGPWTVLATDERPDWD